MQTDATMTREWKTFASWPQRVVPILSVRRKPIAFRDFAGCANKENANSSVREEWSSVARMSRANWTGPSQCSNKCYLDLTIFSHNGAYK